MSQILKQSTAYTFRLGPFLDSTDGNTQENSLTINAASVLLSKAGGALTAKNDATALTGTGANGHYTCVLNATDTGTLGGLRVWSHVTGALAVWQDFEVLPANSYDSIVAGTDLLDTNTAQWLGTTCATPTVAGVPEVDLTHVAGTTTNVSALATNVDAILTDTGTDGVVVAAGAKTGYTLTQGFPANFAALSITAGGLVDVTQAAADKVWSTAARTLTSFGTLAADVWTYATRVLTAGTNIVLAKGTGLTGLNDLSAAQVNAECDTAVADGGLATGANLATVASYIDTEVQAILDTVNHATYGNAALNTDLDALLTRLTATRAGYLDNLNSGVPLSAAAVDAVLDDVVEGTITLRQLQRILLSKIGGKASGGGTASIAFRDLADTKDRIVMAVDSNGNRSAVTLDGA